MPNFSSNVTPAAASLSPLSVMVMMTAETIVMRGTVRLQVVRHTNDNGNTRFLKIMSNLIPVLGVYLYIYRE